MQKKVIKVTYFQRRPRPYRNYSIESYFHSIRDELSEKMMPLVSIARYESSGFFKRLYNCFEAVFRQGDLNHITGDIHYLTILLKKKKNILTILDCGNLKVLKGLKFKLFRFFWYTLPAKKSSVITTISTATKEDLLRYIRFDPDKIIVVPVCISAAFKRSDKHFNTIKPRLLQVGTAPNKNIERLILALEGISCELVIIGPVSPVIKQLAEERKVDLIFFDKALLEHEVVEEYRKADIITLISTLEGFGMPIVEANAVGRVVITGNITSMPEVASNAAHLTDPFSIEQMKSGILKIINDQEYREHLIERGYENCKRFSPAQIAMQFEDIYNSMIEK